MYLDWKQAEKLIITNVFRGLSLNPSYKYGRKIILSPPYKCRIKHFKGVEGYHVQIGKNKFIDVPILMLEDLYSESIKSKGEYSLLIFRKLYPSLSKNSPCYIHTVGKLFEISGLAIRSGRSSYWIKNYLN